MRESGTMQPASPATSSSSLSRRRTSPRPPIYPGRSISGPTTSTAGSRSRCRRSWRMTLGVPWTRSRRSTGRSNGPTSSSRFRARRRTAAIEEAIFAGIPINVTLLFSAEQYVAAARAYQRGVERRIEKGLNPDVVSVASVFISRWDKAVQERAPAGLRNRLGIAIAGRTYRAYRELLASHHSECPGQRRCPAPAAALGQHRDQGPRGLGRAVHRGPRCARHHQHHAGRHPARLGRSRQDSGSDAGGSGATPSQ